MALQWKTASLAAEVTALTSLATAVTAGVGVVNTAVGLATTLSAALPALATVGAEAASLAARTAVETAAAALQFGISTCIIYPQKLDVQRAQLREKIAYFEAQLEQMQKQRPVRVESQAARQRATLEQSILDTAAAVAGDDDDVLAALAPHSQKDSLRSNIERVQSLLTKLNEQDRYMAVPSLDTTFPFASFVNLLEDSFNDQFDTHRPQFDRSFITGGLVLLVSANNVAEFVRSLQALADFMRNLKLRTTADAFANTLNIRRPEGGGAGSGQFPDWENLTLARLLGLETTITDLKAKAKAITFGAPSAKLIRYLAMVTNAVNDTISLQTQLNNLLTTIAGANASVAVLAVPPADGERTFSAFGQSFTLPNGTYGTDGFVEAIRNAKGAPTDNFVAGVVLFTGSPLPGIANLIPGYSSVSPINPELLGTLSSTGAIGAVVAAIQAAVATVNTTTGSISAVIRT